MKSLLKSAQLCQYNLECKWLNIRLTLMNMKLFENYTENVGKRDGGQDRGVPCRGSSSVFCNNRTHIAAVLFSAHQGFMC